MMRGEVREVVSKKVNYTDEDEAKEGRERGYCGDMVKAWENTMGKMSVAYGRVTTIREAVSPRCPRRPMPPKGERAGGLCHHPIHGKIGSECRKNSQ